MCRRSCARWWPADGSGYRPGSAAKRFARWSWRWRPRWKTFAWGVPVCFLFFWLLNVIVIVRGIQDDSLSAGRHRSVSAADRTGAVAVGAQQGGRIRADAGDAFEIPKLRRIFPVFRSVAHRRGGILGHGRAEHSRFHALRAQPARADGGPGARAADDDDVLFVHRHRGNFRDGDFVRAGDLGSGGGAFAA